MDIHSPIISTGSVGRSRSSGQSAASPLDHLNEERREIEDRLTVLGSVLESHRVDMSTPLLTPDGFPRTDIDVAQIRITRSQIIHLLNDRKALMNKIESHLYEHYASQRQASSTVTRNQPVEPEGVAFAYVDSVADNSPAHKAGLQRGDKIIKFGEVHAGNHQRLTGLATTVQSNFGRPIEVVISRAIEHAEGSGIVYLSLTPQSDWGGRGMLGCLFVPL
ncbi:uncharacterized protein V1516DRAFT_625811 [Lipomyces oligophaga]|uniref:uncharacterized protein n=1 Tax=Lipomyces oligophaga TaxID=45792 RepID=UPI0034CEE2BF